MQFNFNLSRTQKGVLYLIGGILITLYAFDFFQQWLNGIVFVIGIAMTTYGFIKVGGIHKLREWLSKAKKDDNQDEH